MNVIRLIAVGVALLIGAFSMRTANAADLCRHNRHSVAVVIGNKDYQRSIPEVPFAHNDAEAIKKFLVERLCYRKGNIIHVKNATFGNLINIFGDRTNPEGTIWNWVRKGRSNVFVYYSGHGAPDIRTGDGFLVPVDGNPDNPNVGLSLQTLVANLKLLKSERIGRKRRVTLVLDACFSGKEASGKALIKGSFTGWRPKRPDPGDDILQFTAAAADQIARWDEKRKHGLFTRAFLDALSGEADRSDFGNGDGTVTPDEMTEFIRDEVAYLARRRYHDDQTPELPDVDRIPWSLKVIEPAAKTTKTIRESEPKTQKSKAPKPKKLSAADLNKLGYDANKRKDYREAVGYYRQAAELGDANAMGNLARKYYTGRGVKKDRSEAFRWYEKAAELGNTESAASLGWLYYKGYGIKKDYAQALKWSRKAADKEHPYALTNLGLQYELGRGVSRDYGKAMELYRRSAKKNHARAMRYVGDLYKEGKGVPKNENTAADWYDRAIELGDTRAMNSLARLLLSSKSVPRDYVRARELFERAARGGVDVAWNNLGYMHMKGYGGSKDPAYAATLVAKALKAGNSFTVRQMSTNSKAWSESFRRELQRILRDEGVYSGPIDGSFGSSTVSAIKRYVGK